MNNWEWPQYVITGIYVLNVLLHSWMHGKNKTGKYSGPEVIIGTAFGVWVLYAGGFWS